MTAPTSTGPTAEPAQWSHIPGLVELDQDHDTICCDDPASHHTVDDPPTGRPCFGCWCYSCGGRTDRPRVRHSDNRTDLPDPDSHRWCYE